MIRGEENVEDRESDRSIVIVEYRRLRDIRCKSPPFRHIDDDRLYICWYNTKKYYSVCWNIQCLLACL